MDFSSSILSLFFPSDKTLENWECQIWGGSFRRRGECQSVLLVMDVASMFCLIHPHPPSTSTCCTRPESCTLLYSFSLHQYCLCYSSFLSDSLFSPFITLWSSFLKWRWKWSVNLSSHQSPQPRSALVSLYHKMMTGTLLVWRNKCGG